MDRPSPSRPAVPALLLAALVLAVFLRVGGHGFVPLDDRQYVYGNEVVRQGLTAEGVRWAFTTFTAGNWHPLTWLSHMADVEMFGLDAGRHHLVNVLLHLLNTLLLFRFLREAAGKTWPAAFAAALFGIHPLHVESVAWVAERKDVLSTFFGLLAIEAYRVHSARPGLPRYAAVAAFFALSLLCKPMLVTLPFALLLLDYWPLGRFVPAPGSARAPVSRLLLEKLPLLALSAASSAMTVLAQAGTISPLEAIPLPLRLLNAVVSAATYLWKAVLPMSLAVFYPHPAYGGEPIQAWKFAAALATLAAPAWIVLHEPARRPWLTVGWAWFLGTLVPVSGLVQAGAQSMAVRYTYVPLIGIFVAAFAAADALRRRNVRAVAAAALAGAVLLPLSAAAFVQVGHWKDGIALFGRAVDAAGKGNWIAWYNLGYALEDAGREPEAAKAYGEVVRIRPRDAGAWTSLGAAYGKLGDAREALECFRRAVGIDPTMAGAHYNLGNAFYQLGDYPQAIEAYREALRIEPGNVDALFNLGIALEMAGDRKEAIAVYGRLRLADPSRADDFLARISPRP
jgi:tetratricopeptide (TPR) repeat protein